MHIPDSFKLRVLHSSLNELGLTSVADHLIELVNHKGLLLDSTNEKLVIASKKVKLLEWINNQLGNGNYSTVLTYLDQAIALFSATATTTTDEPQLSEILNLAPETPNSTALVPVVLTMKYLIKRTEFLDKLITFLLANNDASVSNNSFIQFLGDELSPILDSINTGGENAGVLAHFFPEDIINNLSREEESSKLLSLALQSPLDTRSLHESIFTKKLIFQSTNVRSDSPKYLINKLRQILIKDYFKHLFLPDFYEGALPYLNYQLPNNFLEQVIENTVLYTRFNAPYYLPTRYAIETGASTKKPKANSDDDEPELASEEFIPPIDSGFNSYYKPRFPSKILKSLSTHTGQVWFTKFSPLGNYLITGAADGQLIIYDVLNNFTPVATLISDNITDKNAFVNSTYKPSTASKAVIYCCWDKDENYLVSGSLDTRVRVWYIGGIKTRGSSIASNTRSKHLEPQSNEIKLVACFTLGEKIRTWSCEFLPIDNKVPQFIIGSPDKVLKAYDIYGNELFDFYGNTHENSADQDVKMKDEEDEESIDYEDDENDVDRSHRLSAKESNVNLNLNFGSDNPKPDNFNRINDLAITPNGKVLITANNNKQVDFYIIPNLTNIESITKKIASITLNGRLTSCSISRNGKFLLLSLAPDELQVWDIEDLLEVGKPILFKKLIGHSQSTYIIRSCFGYLDIENNQEELVLSGSDDGDIYIWNLFTGRLITRVKGHEGVCNSVDWNTSFDTPTDYNSDFGKLWCSVGDDKLVKIWGPPGFYQ